MGNGDRRLRQTFLLGLLYFAMGMFAELSGPTLADLKYLYNTNYETLTKAMAGRSVGGIVGALLGGALVDKYADVTDAALSALAMVTAIAVLFIPLAPDVEVTWYGFFVLGLTVCVMNILNTSFILRLWRERSSTVLQLMLTVYGCGALVMPMICSPFLANSTTTTTPQRAGNAETIDKTNVHVPYMIVSFYLVIVSLLFCFWHLASIQSMALSSMARDSTDSSMKSYKDRTWLEYLNPAVYSKGNFKFGTSVLTLLFIYYFNYGGCEKVFGNFIRVLSIDLFDMSRNQASYVNTVFWCSFTSGRLITSVVTRLLSTRLLVLISVILHFMSVWMMKYYATVNLSLFWTLTFIEGFLMAPLFGLAISYGNTVMEVKGMCLTVIILAGSFGQWFYVKFAGVIYDEYGPAAVIHLISTPSLVLVITVVILVLISSKK